MSILINVFSSFVWFTSSQEYFAHTDTSPITIAGEGLHNPGLAALDTSSLWAGRDLERETVSVTRAFVVLFDLPPPSKFNRLCVKQGGMRTYCNRYFHVIIDNMYCVWLVGLGFFVPIVNFTLRTSPLPVMGCKFWPMLGTYGHWACCEGSLMCHTFCETVHPDFWDICLALYNQRSARFCWR